MTTNLTGLSIIGYGRAEPFGSPLPAVNPATAEALTPPYYSASRADIERAAELATGASAEYGRWPGSRKAALLRRIADLFEGSSAGIIERANLETALPLPRLQGETARTCGQLRLFATLVEDGWWLDARIDHGDPGRKPVAKPDVRSMLTPAGPVVVFSSSNFPFAFSVAGGDTASALAAGCPVIVKPHQGHWGVSEMVGLLVVQAARECSAPEGVFSVLYGSGRDVGTALVTHPLIQAVGFTGSRSGGRALMNAAAARPQPIPVYAEMGSINPVFVLPGALEQNPEALAAGLHASVTLGVGQFCTNPGLVFLPDGPAADRFLNHLEKLMTDTPPGTMLTPSICAEYRAGVTRFCASAGVRLATPAPANLGLRESKGQPALFVTDAPTFLSTPALLEEVFGPSTVVVRYQEPDQRLEAARKLDGQLTATVHGTDAELAAEVSLLGVLRQKAGRLVFNGFPTGVEVCHAMVHGGPYPATADGRSTSVGTRAIQRFGRPVCYQNFPDAALPAELREDNPLGLWRLVDGDWGRR